MVFTSVEMVGIEPDIFGFSVRRIDHLCYISILLWVWVELNLKPHTTYPLLNAYFHDFHGFSYVGTLIQMEPAFQAGPAIVTGLHTHVFAGVAGLKPTTSGFGDRRSVN